MLLLNDENINTYIDYLRFIASLSKLFSNSNIPFLYYRVAENIFFFFFNAVNLARLDIVYDA